MRKLTIGDVTYVGADADVDAAVAPIIRMRIDALARITTAFGAAIAETIRQVGEKLVPVMHQFRDAWRAALLEAEFRETR